MIYYNTSSQVLNLRLIQKSCKLISLHLHVTAFARLTLSWPAGHICFTNKEPFQVRWDNSIPIFLHAAIYLEVSLSRWTSENAFSRVQMILCAMLLCNIAHSNAGKRKGPASRDPYLTFKISSRHCVIYFNHMVCNVNHVVEGQSPGSRSTTGSSSRKPTLQSLLWRQNCGWPPSWDKPTYFYSRYMDFIKFVNR
jgi:hypothetical protein